MRLSALISLAILMLALFSCGSLKNKDSNQHENQYATIKSYTEGKTREQIMLPKGIDIITFSYLNEKHLYGFFGYPEIIKIPPGKNKLYIRYTRYKYNAFFCYELSAKPKEEFVVKSEMKGLNVSLWIENSISNKTVGRSCEYDK